MSALEEFQIQQALTDLFNNFQNTAVGNAFERENLLLNQSAQVGDLQRAFQRQAPQLGVPFARRGLETSGIRNVGIDRQVGDHQRNLSRVGETFNRQFNQLSVSDLQNQTQYSQGVANIDSYDAARRSEIATQIREL